MSIKIRTRHGPIADWDHAFDNRAAVGLAKVEAAMADWTARAGAFRDQMQGEGRARLDQAYGRTERQRFDLFLPDGEPCGLVAFVHGGYWRTFDKSFWSHFAVGALAHGQAVAVPSYTLCPEARIAGITEEIGRFLNHIAREIDGPIQLVGHSAGGHLVSRMITTTAPLNRDIQLRIRKAVSISGVHDLRPLLRTAINETLRLDLAEARAESPVLLEPIVGADLTCWVGADELDAFRQQNALLAELWHGLGAMTDVVEAAGKHHFDVIEALADPQGELIATLLAVGSINHSGSISAGPADIAGKAVR